MKQFFIAYRSFIVSNGMNDKLLSQSFKKEVPGICAKIRGCIV